jgi:hypothetical protein
MSRKKRQESEHRNPHEMRLWAIVDSLVTDSSEKAAYLSFARELVIEQRRKALPDSPEFRIQRAESRVGEVKPPRTPRTPMARPFPDFSRRTKRVVEKWFRRGLSGHLMWLIGQEVLR